MKDYTITGVSHKVKNWSNNYGDFTTYYVMLDGQGDDAISLNKKSDSPAPKEDDVIYGEITETEFGKKFKTAMKQSNESGSSSKPSASTYKDNSKNITLGLVWKTIAGIRGLPEDDEDFAKFYEIVDAHYSELVRMQEKASE